MVRASISRNESGIRLKSSHLFVFANNEVEERCITDNGPWNVHRVLGYPNEKLIHDQEHIYLPVGLVFHRSALDRHRTGPEVVFAIDKFDIMGVLIRTFGIVFGGFIVGAIIVIRAFIKRRRIGRQIGVSPIDRVFC